MMKVGNAVVSVGRLGVSLQGGDNDIIALGQHFKKFHWAKLSCLLENSLCEYIMRELETSEFSEHVHKELEPNSELCLKHDQTVELLNFVMNNAELFRVVESIAGNNRIGSFAGRVYRFLPGKHFIPWHSDDIENRLVGISLNLSAASYSGGRLQLRYWEDPDPFQEVANTGLGDAIIFRIDPKLCHRVTSVTQSSSRTVLAGWFRSEPEFGAAFGKF